MVFVGFMDLKRVQAIFESNVVSRLLLIVLLLPMYRLFSFLNRKRKFFYMAYQKNFMVDPALHKRQKYWKKCGAHINGTVSIGYDVYFDASNASFITIDEGATITSRCLILCHKRDLSKYYVGEDINTFPYIHAPIHICKNAHVGMGSIVMPGVTIGEGAIIGAGSIVTKDIPAWTVAVGIPAKVVREIKEKDE